MKRILHRLSFAVGFNLSVSCLAAGIAKIEMPPETETFKPGAGVELANGQCLVCHSVEYVTTQPTFPRLFWAGSVKKMREKYGAAIPDDQIEPLLDYLTREYGVPDTHATTGATPASAPKPSGASPPAMNAEGLAVRYGCLGCHNVSVNIVGPAYEKIAAKYRTDADAIAKITEQIQKGGSGKWGSVIMPPFPQISPDETKVLTEWILRQKQGKRES